MSSNVIPFATMQAPSFVATLQQTPDQIKAMNAAAAVGTGGGGQVNRISLKQARFRLVVGGVETFVLPTLDMNVVAVRVNDGITKTWFGTDWNPNAEATAPLCSSDDGIRPRADSEAKQCGPDGLCATCPQNQWGSKINILTQEKIKACTDTKRVAIIAPGPDGRFTAENDLYQLGVPPASLKEFGAYIRGLSSMGTPATYNMVVTNVSFDPQAQFPKLLFKPTRWLEADEYAAISARYDKDDAKLVCGLADAQTMRSATPAQLTHQQPVQQNVQQQPVQQPVQQQAVQQPQQNVQQFQQPQQNVQQPVQQPQQQAPAGWGEPQVVQQPIQEQPQVQQFQQPQQNVQQPQQTAQTQAPAGWGEPQAVVQQPQQNVQQTTQQQPQQNVQQPQGNPGVSDPTRVRGRPGGGRARRNKQELAEDAALDAADAAAQGGQVQQPVTQQPQVQQFQQPQQNVQQPQVQQFQQPEQQAAPQQFHQQTAAQAPAFDASEPFAGANLAPVQQSGAPNQPNVADPALAFSGWDD